MVIQAIALTGTIGSGKSAVSKIFEKLGASVIDADLLAREVVAIGTTGYKKVVKEFGNAILNSDGSLNRKELANLIFNNKELKEKLEDILHPLIRESFEEKYKSHLKQYPEKLLVAVIPLLFESKNSYPMLEKKVLVIADTETCINRIIKRDGVSREQAVQKISSQMPQEEKIKRSDYIITNNGTIEELEVSIKKLYDELTTA
jgi:dephospho-CoA kinase